MNGSRLFGMMHDILHDRLQGEDISNLTLPESTTGMDADGETGRRVPPEATDSPSMAQRAVRR